MNAALMVSMTKLPEQLRKTLTWDRGKELRVINLQEGDHFQLNMSCCRCPLSWSATIRSGRPFQQYARYQRVFRNDHNSIRSIIARRWTGLQLSPAVVTTIRLRDPRFTMPLDLVTLSPEGSDDTTLSGVVADAGSSNLFPRRFTLIADNGSTGIYIFWWKFSTPVRDGDMVTLRGSLVTAPNCPVVRLTNFTRHWLRINE
jgi:hypothetical protein